jgi:hypothetical protein
VTRRRLHPDWPEADLSLRSYHLPAPVYDLAETLERSNPMLATAPATSAGEALHILDIKRVVRYHISYHGAEWLPGNDVSEPYAGTELDMNLTAELMDGRWISVQSWNDYTGWGCQDGSEVRIGDSESQVVEFGLDNNGRKVLGYSE